LITPYIHIAEKHSKWHAFFAIRLASIIAFNPSSGEYKAFAFELLNRQIDFLNSLDRPEDDVTFELRIICGHPEGDQARGRIVVVLIAKVTDTIRDNAISKAGRISQDVWSLLSTLSGYYEFVPVENEDIFKSIYDPFEIGSIVEVFRREDIIEVETAKRLRGFGSSGVDHSDSKDSIYFVYPFIWSTNTMSTVFRAMLMQENPCFISICLKPVEFSDSIERLFLKQIERGERYLSISSGSDSPIVNARVAFITKTLQSLLLRLEDSPFLTKIRIVSSGNIARNLIDTFGVEITEHTGSPDLLKDVNDAYVFSGGYDWHLIKGDEMVKEIEEIKFMEINFSSHTEAPEEARCLRYLFDATQANCAFRLPVPLDRDFPGLDTVFYKKISPPPDIPTEGITIGRVLMHGQCHEIKMARVDRRKHMYIVGQTGTGKSTLMLRMILQDINNNEGVAVLDPHGELIDEILPRVPERRVKDIIYVNLADTKAPIVINMLEYKDVLEKDFVVNQLFEIFNKLYNMEVVAGPMFEQYMKNALYLIFEDPDSGSTILEVQKIFTDRDFRNLKLSKCKDRYVKEFWEQIASRADGEISLKNMAPYITSKLTMFIYNNVIRNIISSQRSSFDMRDIMDSGRVLLVDLCKGRLGSINSHFIGMVIISKILSAALSRSDIENKKNLKDFYLYVDEFHNLATDSFITLLSEARKYNLNAILADQYLTQVPADIQEAIIGNVGTIASFRLGIKDAEILERKFYPVYTKFDLLSLPNWRVCISMLSNGESIKPFIFNTIPETTPKSTAVGERIKRYSQKTYGRKIDDIEKEVEHRWKCLKEENTSILNEDTFRSIDIDEEI